MIQQEDIAEAEKTLVPCPGASQPPEPQLNKPLFVINAQSVVLSYSNSGLSPLSIVVEIWT